MNEDVKKYLDNIITAVCGAQAQYSENLLMYGKLYSLVDKTVLFVINVSEDVDNNIMQTFFHDTVDPVFTYYTNIADMQNRILSKYEECCTFTSSTSSIVYDNPDMDSDETFAKLRNIKSTDGVAFFFADNAMIPIIKGIPNLNKQDKLAMRVFNINGYYFVNMKIFKYKIKKEVDMYLRILDLAGSNI